MSEPTSSPHSLSLGRPLAPVDPSLLTQFPRRNGSAGARQASFAEILGRQSPGAESKTIEERARDGAEQLVAVALVQPLFKQMRASGAAAPPFAPTAAERQFHALQDADIARQIVRGGRFPMVDRLAQGMLRLAYGAAGDAAPVSGKGPA